MLIALLSHENAGVQVASAQAIAVLSENLTCRDAIGQWGQFAHDFLFLAVIRS